MAVCSYLNHAAVDGKGGADHVDVGGGGGALPLGQRAHCGRVRRGVVEGMGRRVAMHSAGRREGGNFSRDKAYTRLRNIFVFAPPPCCVIDQSMGNGANIATSSLPHCTRLCGFLISLLLGVKRDFNVKRTHRSLTRKVHFMMNGDLVFVWFD